MTDIGLVTDSNSQLPPELALEHDVAIVALPVVIDGQEFLEGVTIDTDDFYARLASGAAVSTSQPSPGAIAETYGRLLASGCDSIVSVHVGSALSGTVNSARLAASTLDAEVRIVDTGQASFSIGCAVLAAAEVRAAGGSADAMVAAAEVVSTQVRNVFVMGGLELARASGRVEVSQSLEALDAAPQIPVMTFEDGELVVLGAADDMAEAVDIMRTVVEADAGPRGLRVAAGVADRAAFGFYEEFEAAFANVDGVELLRYRCGPTVGAFTGLGTVGACWCPLRV